MTDEEHPPTGGEPPVGSEAGRPPAGFGEGPPPTEEEMRARLEEELRRITVRDIVVQTVVSLVNLGGQRLGITPDTRDLRDLAQVRMAIEGVRALLPLLEQETPDEVAPVRDALSRLQLAYAREVGAPPDTAAGPPGPGAEPQGQPAPGRGGTAGQGPGGPEVTRPASSGRLWVPPGSEG